nr:hypothetical protein [Tanacetum cinerariifolium]
MDTKNNIVDLKSFRDMLHISPKQYSAILPIELTTGDIRNTKAYKEYYACVTREATPKPKASARRKRGASALSTTPPTLIATPTPITTVEDQGLRISEAERMLEEEDVDELYHDVDINQGRGLQVSQDIDDSYMT